MIKSEDKKKISSTLHRSMIVMLLLCSFALGVKAQPSWWPQGTNATGIDYDNGVVYLNDLENHNWTYYSGVDGSVDNEYYNDNYLGKIYSPNPRNVMITYKGRDTEDNKTSNVKVSIDAGEDQHTFVYYKTLEEGSTAGEYPYTVISNPFSVRPSVVNDDGTKTYYGFNGWRIIDGGEFIKGYDDTDVLPLDAEIMFVDLPYDTEEYPVNCISANIELQATWVPAKVTYLASVKTDNTNYTFDVANSTASSTTYENNFLVINKTYSGAITVSSPCTIMMVEPDGSANYRTKTFSNLITPMAGGNTKIEFAHWKPSGDIDALGRNFTIGRGMVMDGTKRALYGTNTGSVNVDQILKVESGKFSTFTHYGAEPTSIVKQKIIYGCDYDRAKNDNSKLEFTGRPLVASSKVIGNSSGQEICRVYSLSGRFLTSKTVSDASRNESYYMSVLSTKNYGYRYLEIQGGEWVNIAGGMDKNTSTDPGFTFRMKGGHIKGSVYGAAEYLGSSGTRVLLITGGKINGWVAGGANGTDDTGGDLNGKSYVYIGGNARIESNTDNPNDVINRAVGGNVFGAGCGYASNKTAGIVKSGTNVVIADNAYVERGVYGGGSYGYTENTSNIYITGGTIGGINGGVNGTSYNENIQGGVYGGACQNKGGNVNIFMTGGTVNGGIYGGSNASGTLSGNVNIKITGGTIGGIVNGNQTNANVYGGGYGSGTAVNGAVSMTLGNSGASTGATVNGDVYGGGAEGKVNNSISINVNAANINGDLYGGGHGASAEVSGNSAITMTGGTIGNVFGGGNAAKLIGNSSVTITDGTVTSNVYGGGNQAEVKGTTNVVIGN